MQVGFLKWLGSPENTVGIRSAPVFPGDRTGRSVAPGVLVEFTAVGTVPHTHTDGKALITHSYKYVLRVGIHVAHMCLVPCLCIFFHTQGVDDYR